MAAPVPTPPNRNRQIRNLAERLARTGISAALATFVLTLAAKADEVTGVQDWSTLGALLAAAGTGAATAGANAVVIGVQKLLPFTPDPT